jgi:hypothetical protein
MCGRAHLSTDVSEIKIVFSIPPHRPTPNFRARTWRGPTRRQSFGMTEKQASAASISCVGASCRIWAKDIKVGPQGYTVIS